MPVVIRMKRTGRRNRPCYRVTVNDSRAPRDGKVIETLGLYDPIAPRPELQLDVNVERARFWLEKGAQPSETVNSILRKLDCVVERARDKPRKRPGRYRATATKTRRNEAKAKRAAAKDQRRTARIAARREAAKAAAAAAAAEGGDGDE